MLVFLFVLLDGDRYIGDLWVCLISFQTDIISGELIKVMDIRIQMEFRSRKALTRDQLFDQWYMPVINMGICDHVYKLSYLHITYLCQHMHKHRILYNIPVVSRKHIL